MQYTDADFIWDNYSPNIDVWEQINIDEEINASTLAQLFHAESCRFFSNVSVKKDSSNQILFKGTNAFCYIKLTYSQDIIKAHIKSNGIFLFGSSTLSNSCISVIFNGDFVYNIDSLDIGLSKMTFYETYKWKGAAISKNDIIPVQLATAPTRNRLPKINDVESITQNDISENFPLLDANIEWINNYYGGMVTVPNFEITKDNKQFSYRGYSYKETRDKNPVTDGNYIYDDNLDPNNKEVLNKSWQFNFGGGTIPAYTPVLVFSKGDTAPNGKKWQSYSIHDESITITYADATTSDISLNAQDKVIKYTQSAGTINYFKARRGGAASDEQWISIDEDIAYMAQWPVQSGSQMSWSLYMTLTEGPFSIYKRNNNDWLQITSGSEYDEYMKIIETKNFQMVSNWKTLYGAYSLMKNPSRSAFAGVVTPSGYDDPPMGNGNYIWSINGTCKRFKGISINPSCSFTGGTDWWIDDWSYSSPVGGPITSSVKIHTDTLQITTDKPGLLPTSFKLKDTTTLTDISVHGYKINLQPSSDYTIVWESSDDRLRMYARFWNGILTYWKYQQAPNVTYNTFTNMDISNAFQTTFYSPSTLWEGLVVWKTAN